MVAARVIPSDDLAVFVNGVIQVFHHDRAVGGLEVTKGEVGYNSNIFAKRFHQIIHFFRFHGRSGGYLCTEPCYEFFEFFTERGERCCRSDKIIDFQVKRDYVMAATVNFNMKCRFHE